MFVGSEVCLLSLEHVKHKGVQFNSDTQGKVIGFYVTVI